MTARSVNPQEWQPSRRRSSPPPTEPRRTSYTPAPADKSFPEEEEDWEPPSRSVVGAPCGRDSPGLLGRMSEGSWSLTKAAAAVEECCLAPQEEPFLGEERCIKQTPWPGRSGGKACWRQAQHGQRWGGGEQPGLPFSSLVVPCSPEQRQTQNCNLTLLT